MRTRHLLILAIIMLYGASMHGQKPVSDEYFLETRYRQGTPSFYFDNYWYKDSVFIFEQKVNYSGGSDDSIVIPQEYVTTKFIYFNLRSKECFDYESFSDTATPLLYYKIAKGDTWFYPKKDDSLEIRRPGVQYQHIGDTIIDGEIRQRLKATFISVEYNFWDETIYYFDCDKKIKQYWESDNQVAKYFPPCLLTRIDLMIAEISKTLPPEITEFKVRNILSSEEVKVFEAWIKNSHSITLPVSTIAEVKRFPQRPLKYKDHPFVKTIYEAELEQWRSRSKKD